MNLKHFKHFLKCNLTRKFTDIAGFHGTLIDAYNLDSASERKVPVLLQILDACRKKRLKWWVHYSGPKSAWNVMQRNYTTCSIDGQVIPCSIIPVVREIETSQLAICTGNDQHIFCSSCYRIRIENESLKLQLKAALRGEDTCSPTVDTNEPQEAQIIRDWFDATYHRQGSGNGYSRSVLRQDLTKYLTQSYGYQTNIGANSDLWKWFVREVVKDASRQYRAFRIWKK